MASSLLAPDKSSHRGDSGRAACHVHDEKPYNWVSARLSCLGDRLKGRSLLNTLQAACALLLSWWCVIQLMTGCACHPSSADNERVNHEPAGPTATACLQGTPDWGAQHVCY